MKTLLLILSALVLFQSSAQSTLTGTILSAENEPASFATVTLKGTTKGTVTNTDGFFTLRGVKAGKYTLQVSSVGFMTLEQDLEVVSGADQKIPAILLQVASTQLQAVQVSAQKELYSRGETPFVSKMPLKALENPQVYNTITSELLKDQVVTTLDDALKNAPGVFKLWESTGRGGDGAAYYSLRGFAVQPKMWNGLPALTNGSRDPIGVEQIEVVKGPSGTLFGSSVVSYGGIINVVTKQPKDGFFGELGYATGSYGQNRVTADVNTPLDESGKVILRVTGAYQYQGSFQDAGFRKSTYLAPSLVIRSSDRLSFLVETEFYNPEGTNQTMLFLNRNVPLAIHSLDELGYDPKKSYTSNSISVKNPVFNFRGQMNYKLSDSWRSQTIVSSSHATSDGLYSYLYDLQGAANNFSRFVSNQNVNNSSFDLQQNVNGDFRIGSLRNRLLVGLDYLTLTGVANSTGYVTAGMVTLRDSTGDSGNLSEAAVNALFANSAVNVSTTRQTFYSAYVSDVLNLTPQLAILVSLRADRFDNAGVTTNPDDNYKQWALSPKLGLLYQPVQDKLAVFANYSNGFSNVAPRIQGDGSSKTFHPERANQFETGVKLGMLDGKVTGTLSYFDIQVTDIVMEDPEQVNFFIQGGKEYRKGWEADVAASPISGLNLKAGYSYTDAKITKSDSEIYLDRRPEEAGPRHLVNGWASYRIQNSVLKGLGFGFGGNFMSENKILNRATTGTFTLPAYTILNASLSYQLDDFRIDLKANNLTDKQYYSGWSTVNPQMPRAYTGSVSYRF